MVIIWDSKNINSCKHTLCQCNHTFIPVLEHYNYVHVTKYIHTVRYLLSLVKRNDFSLSSQSLLLKEQVRVLWREHVFHSGVSLKASPS